MLTKVITCTDQSGKRRTVGPFMDKRAAERWMKEIPNSLFFTDEERQEALDESRLEVTDLELP